MTEGLLNQPENNEATQRLIIAECDCHPLAGGTEGGGGVIGARGLGLSSKKQELEPRKK